MMRSLRWLGAGLLLWPVLAHRPAVAAEDAAQSVAAFVDPTGRVLPSRARKVPVAAAPTTPCADGSVLSPDAAKALVERIATEEDFYPEFVLSVAKIESRYVSTALSDRGAYGLMQLMPDTARRFGVDRCDPVGNVRGGIRYLRALHNRYRNPFFILAAYNAGEEVVRRARGVPASSETVRFVADVMNDFYAWPSAVGEKPAPVAASPDLVERAPRRSPRLPARTALEPVAEAQVAARVDAASAAARWDGDFVLHVD